MDENLENKNLDFWNSKLRLVYRANVDEVAGLEPNWTVIWVTVDGPGQKSTVFWAIVDGHVSKWMVIRLKVDDLDESKDKIRRSKSVKVDALKDSK